jgi:hypothetical protein
VSGNKPGLLGSLDRRLFPCQSAQQAAEVSEKRVEGQVARPFSHPIISIFVCVLFRYEWLIHDAGRDGGC